MPPKSEHSLLVLACSFHPIRLFNLLRLFILIRLLSLYRRLSLHQSHNQIR